MQASKNCIKFTRIRSNAFQLRRNFHKEAASRYNEEDLLLKLHNIPGNSNDDTYTLGLTQIISKNIVEKDAPVVLMLHGAISNSSTFFSPKAKGLGPFLASKGCNVFIADNRGRGFSKPSLKEEVKTKPIQHGQFETIRYDIPTISTAVKKISGQTKQHWIAHSWGGILMSSTMAYKGEKFTSHILSMICLGMCYHVVICYMCAAFCFTSFCSSYLILTSHTHSLTLTYTFRN